MPRVGSTLESARLPRGLAALVVQVKAEEGGLDVFAKLAGSFVASKRNESDAVALWSLPFAVEPGAGDHEICVLRIVFFGVAENLPRSPRILLIPESCDIQVRHGGSVKLADPGFLLPELVVVRMVDA